MSGQAQPGNVRISLRAVQEMDELALRFRRRLRDLAIELSREAGHAEPIGPDTVAQALPLVCGELLSQDGSGLGDERGSDGQRPRAA